MPVSPEWVVAPPGTVQPAHSLLNSANIVDEPAGSRWESGFVFKPENCIEAEVWQPCGDDGRIVVQLQIDATGGSAIVAYNEENPQVLPYNATSDDLEAAIAAASNGASNGAVTIFPVGVPGNPPAAWIFVIQQGGGAGYNPNLLAVIDNPEDPLTGGAGILISLVSLGADQGWSTNLTPEDYGVETKKDYDGEQGNVTYAPFVVEVPYTCSTWGFQENAYEARALRQLDAGLSKAIEREFWTGEKNLSNMNLTYWTPNDDAHVLNPGGAAAPVAVDPATGLVLLEAALAACYTGAMGMLHAPTAVAERWAAYYFIDADEEGSDHMLRTRSREDIVIVGAGYPGTGPFGQPDPDDGEMWAFATGMVDVRLGEPMIYPETFSEALDRATNTVTFRGEQVAAANWDGCCSFAVLIDLSLTPAQTEAPA